MIGSLTKNMQRVELNVLDDAAVIVHGEGRSGAHPARQFHRFGPPQSPRAPRGGQPSQDRGWLPIEAETIAKAGEEGDAEFELVADLN